MNRDNREGPDKVGQLPWRERHRHNGVSPAPSVPHDHILDAGIAPVVELLRAEGVETFESCEGGDGHAFAAPTIRFHGEVSEGLRALAVALRSGLTVRALRRYWAIIDGEPIGPDWEIEFYRPAQSSKSAKSPNRTTAAGERSLQQMLKTIKPYLARRESGPVIESSDWQMTIETPCAKPTPKGHLLVDTAS